MDDQLIWAGIIWRRVRNQGYTVTIDCETIESYFGRRYLNKTLGPYTQVDQNVILRDLFQHGTENAVFSLAYDTPATGVLRDRTQYTEASGTTILELAGNLADVINGPEWTIEPYWLVPDPNKPSTFYLRHRLVSRFPYLGTRIPEPDWTFSAPGNVLSWEYAEDYTAENYATQVTATGSGDGQAMVRSDTQRDRETVLSGVPIVEARPSTQMSKKADVNEVAIGILKDLHQGARTVQLTARLDGVIDAGRIPALGDTARVIIDRDEFGLIEELCRIVGWSIDTVAGVYTPTLTPYVDPYEYYESGYDTDTGEEENVEEA